jgi:hypothetical protein
VSAWRILGGADPGHLAPVAVVARAGFETAVSFSSGGGWFAAEALDAQGRVLGSSGPVPG